MPTSVLLKNRKKSLLGQRCSLIFKDAVEMGRERKQLYAVFILRVTATFTLIFLLNH
jgi:hypothetical protein